MATFIDTSYVIALANTADLYHEHASALALQPLGPFVTTEVVLTEIGNALSRLRWRQYAVSILQRFQDDPDIEVVPGQFRLV
jgi:predicted nucleic acid-binding protein